MDCFVGVLLLTIIIVLISTSLDEAITLWNSEKIGFKSSTTFSVHINTVNPAQY